MDLTRKLNSQLVALDDHNRPIAYYEGDSIESFLEEIIRLRHLETRRITIHNVCPYVWTDPDKWYAEDEPLDAVTVPHHGDGAHP